MKSTTKCKKCKSKIIQLYLGWRDDGATVSNTLTCGCPYCNADVKIKYDSSYWIHLLKKYEKDICINISLIIMIIILGYWLLTRLLVK